MRTLNLLNSNYLKLAQSSTFLISAHSYHSACSFILIKLPQELMLSSLSDSNPINFFVVQPSYLEFFLFSCPLSPTYNPYYKLDSFLQQTPEKQELRQNIGKHHRGVKTLSSTYDGVVDGVFYQKTPSWALARVRNGLRIISLIL